LSQKVAEAADYQLFGLRIRSEIPLPELFRASGGGDPDVTISRALVAEAATPGLQVQGAALLLTVPEVGRYRIEAGRKIIVDAEANVADRNLRLFLLGSAFGALLHQRGLLPLHANAVEVDGRAVAFMGESGAGKSTLAAWFHDRGHRVVADDVCVIRFDGDTAIAQPGLPRLRLWDEALEATGRNAADFMRSYIGDETFNKYDVPIGVQTAADREIPLAAAYVLDRGERMAVRPLQGIDAAEAVFAHTYRGGFISAAKSEQSHWDACVRLVRDTPLFHVSRVWGLDQLDEQSRMMMEHIRQLPSKAVDGTPQASP
jgi:hypothetical protein